MPNVAEVLLNSLGSTARGWRGSRVLTRQSTQPDKPLKLYDIEACPYCRLVREVLTELDLDVMILPCPKGGTRYRAEAQAIGGKQQFPLLVDDNTGTVMYESAAIIDYLARTYRGRARGANPWLRPVSELSSSAASGFRLRPTGMSGMRVRASTPPAGPLELFSFESSPYSMAVRARLCELELPYLLRNTGKGGWKDIGSPSFRDKLFKGPMDTTRNRAWLSEHTGRVQLPYLIDPNTGTQMYESADILLYLDRTYAN